MDLLERYLDAVAAQLPRDSREDIIAELRDMLLTRFEVEEERLGRSLTDDEREAILRETGHPLLVAARYRKGPQSLVGPELFPWWLFAAKVGLTILAGVQILGLLLDLLGGTSNAGQDISQAFHGFFTSGLVLLGALTLGAAIFEHYGVRPPWMREWRVKDLGVLRLSDPANWAADAGLTGTEKPKPTFAPTVRAPRAWPGAEPLGGIIAGVVFILWWTGVLHFGEFNTINLRGERAWVEAAPIWSSLFMTILAYAVALLAIEVSRLLQPHLRRVQAGLAIIVAAWGGWILWTVFQAGHWATLRQGGETHRVEGDLSMLNLDVLRGLSAGSHDSWPSMAEGLGVIAAWGLAFFGLSLVFTVLSNLGRMLFPTRR